MKKIYILIAIISLSFFSAIAKTLPNGYISTSNPAIGVKLSSQNNGGSYISLIISVKNIGDEPLTNIFFTQNTIGNVQIFLQQTTISNLAPGEEIQNIYVSSYQPNCFDQCQIIVHATTPTNIEITDLSSDPSNSDNNGLPGSYYNDLLTYCIIYQSINAYQYSTYNDLNGNSIIDVGDAINYIYDIDASQAGISNGYINDNNAIVLNPYCNFSIGSYYSTTGIHYLTQADVNLGYVYNNSNFQSQQLCYQAAAFYGSNCSGCPNPNNANIVTKLTSQLPNQISGKVKFNANNDNCATGFDFPNRFVSTTFGPDTYASYTNNTGDYHILIPNSGNYTTAASNYLGTNFTSSPISITTTSSGSGSVYNNTNFCISSANNLADLQVNMFNINQAIPGFNATYRIYYANRGTNNQIGRAHV